MCVTSTVELISGMFLWSWSGGMCTGRVTVVDQGSRMCRMKGIACLCVYACKEGCQRDAVSVAITPQMQIKNGCGCLLHAGALSFFATADVAFGGSPSGANPNLCLVPASEEPRVPCFHIRHVRPEGCCLVRTRALPRTDVCIKTAGAVLRNA